MGKHPQSRLVPRCLQDLPHCSSSSSSSSSLPAARGMFQGLESAEGCSGARGVQRGAWGAQRGAWGAQRDALGLRECRVGLGERSGGLGEHRGILWG